ncbi:MAG: dipeptidase [Pyrinomonadaceae bacterium]|nr:dipeptidase [Pyrinomonadaceae bacterium]MBP6213829.1 dipeptidase [Pyrinomonadaceae bacterium]
MKRFLSAFIAVAIVVASFSFGINAQTPDDEAKLIAKAKKIHADVITLDTHNDIDTRNFTDAVNYTQDLPNQVNLPKMTRGGLDVSWMIVYTGQGPLTDAGYRAAYANAIDKFEAIHRLAEKIAPSQIELALTSKDVRRINRAGKKIAMIGVENAYPVGTDLANIKDFAMRGARYMSLSHNGHSQFADSNTGEGDKVWLHNGLSDLGKKAVVEMNKWGIMIDLSHPSKESNIQVLKLTKAPVIASHSGARALCDHSRNLSDEELELIKQNGGVVQAVAFRAYVSKEKSDLRSKLSNEISAELAAKEGFKILARADAMKLPEAERNVYMTNVRAFRAKIAPIVKERLADKAPDVNVKDFVNHIDYLVKKIGIDHVGISSDFDGGGGVEGWDDASETLNVTIELVRRGYTKQQIAKLWSGNLLRVLDDVQKVAKKLQAEK